MAKKLTKSNDNIPSDELLLAGVIQNAKAHGLKATVEMFYRDDAGFPCNYFDPNLASCCVLGAYNIKQQGLPRLTDKQRDGMAGGNDDRIQYEYGLEHAYGYVVGQSFQQAMKQ